MYFGNAEWETVLRRLGIGYTRRKTGVCVILCPFHKERHGSLHCWPASGHYHCHGCRAGGTIEEFVVAHGLDYEQLYRCPINDPNQLGFDFAK